MFKKGATVIGIDVAQAPLEVARQHQIQQGFDIDYRQVAIEELPKELEGSFDVVTCLEMLEHVPDPKSVIQACCRMVKPVGQVFFSTINKNLKAFFFAILGRSTF